MAQFLSPGSNPGRGNDTYLSDSGATYLSDAGAIYNLAAQKVTDFFPRAGNGGTGAACTPAAPSVAKAAHLSASGTGGSRALAPRLSPRSSSSGVPPVVLGSHGLAGVLSDGKSWEWTGAGRRRGSHSGLPRG